MRHLSICFVSQEYPEETGWGGIGTYTHEMAHGLAREGHAVCVLSRALETPSHTVEDDGVHVYRVLPRCSLNGLPVLWRLNRLWEGYRLAVRTALRHIVPFHGVEVIECPELHAESLLYQPPRRKLPLQIVRLHTGSNMLKDVEPSTRSSWWERHLEIMALRLADFVTAPTRTVLDRSRHRLLMGPRSAAVIPNPINTGLFHPGRLKPGPHPTEQGPLILCVGRPRFLKGFHVLAAAVPRIRALVPDSRFLFVGGRMGLGTATIDSEFKRFLGNAVHCPYVEVREAIPHREMPPVYREADVCVVPSLWECFGYTCAEAMACGKPVVASRVGGLQEIVEDGVSGILVEPNDPVQLAHAVTRLLLNDDLRKSMGHAARRRIEDHFSTKAVVPRMALLYQRLLERSSAPRDTTL